MTVLTTCLKASQQTTIMINLVEMCHGKIFSRLAIRCTNDCSNHHLFGVQFFVEPQQIRELEKMLGFVPQPNVRGTRF
jgi:hypothetical protein